MSKKSLTIHILFIIVFSTLIISGVADNHEETQIEQNLVQNSQQLGIFGNLIEYEVPYYLGIIFLIIIALLKRRNYN